MDDEHQAKETMKDSTEEKTVILSHTHDHVAQRSGKDNILTEIRAKGIRNKELGEALLTLRNAEPELLSHMPKHVQVIAKIVKEAFADAERKFGKIDDQRIRKWMGL